MDKQLVSDFQSPVSTVAGIQAVPTILEVIRAATGMGFAAVARVTPERWIACYVGDGSAYGLQTGDELNVENTICHEICQHQITIIIENVAEDETYRDHPAPGLFGFQSYISTPIVLPDGSFFGTLCAFDPRPARLNNPATTGMFKLFAELIAFHIDAKTQLALSKADLALSEGTLSSERETAELREQFIAVLGHDLRNPLAAIATGADLLARTPLNEKASRMVAVIQKSAARIGGLIDDVMDFARGRLGSGLTLNLTADQPLAPVLHHVIAELSTNFPDKAIETAIKLDDPILCDRPRIAQLLSNLLGNALTYGAPQTPIRVMAVTDSLFFELSVTNAGDPIPPAAMEKLFQPFSRGAVRPSQQGLGLGLFIVSEIARAHGGTLNVVSSTEETRFTFRMPRGQANTA